MSRRVWNVKVLLPNPVKSLSFPDPPVLLTRVHCVESKGLDFTTAPVGETSSRLTNPTSIVAPSRVDIVKV